MRRRTQAQYFALLAITVLGMNASVHAQSGLRETLERMDKDGNGRIDPEEITPLARPYLERVAERRRLSLNRSNSIEALQRESRIYHAMQNGSSDEDIRVRKDYRIRDFEPDDDDMLIPDFGLAEIKYRYTQDDLDDADRMLRRYDRNRDGYLDRDEARRGDWSKRDPFLQDVNEDGLLSRLELGQRYARRRMLSSDTDELIQRARRGVDDIRPSERSDRDGRNDSQWWRSGGSRTWLAASMISRFDLNRNGRLESAESKLLNLPVGQIDADRDGEISRDELQAYTDQIQDDIGDDAEGLPGWFYELDKDRDRQVTMMEFTEDWTSDKMAEFLMFDANEDGLLTADEVAASKALMGGAFENNNAEVIAPRKTIISELDIVDDVVIGDVNLQLDITHSNVGDLDAFLTSPDGTRIELFTDIGGSGNHFNNTTFDDDASVPITKARPPYEGKFLPEGRTRGQPSLKTFNGKSAKGVWQLVIRGTRSGRFGMLHSWRLLIRAEEQLVGDLAMAVDDTQRETSVTVSRPPEPEQDRENIDRESKRAEKDRFMFNADMKRKAAEAGWTSDRIEKFRDFAKEIKASGRKITAEDKAEWMKQQGKPDRSKSPSDKRAR